MITEDKIMEAARLIGEAAKPAKVILFGSYARGEATEDSDLDFLVIEPAVDDKGQEMVRLHKALRPLRMTADVLVYSEAEVKERQDWCSTPVYWALREGKVVYETR
ncbi:MAG: nucleotidyltransferase domain-containing protein [Nitrospinae bacterium]|nr:nucleotidyltransferase domain-containing protein [Nitrospinota bacterium]